MIFISQITKKEWVWILKATIFRTININQDIEDENAYPLQLHLAKHSVASTMWQES